MDKINELVREWEYELLNELISSCKVFPNETEIRIINREINNFKNKLTSEMKNYIKVEQAGLEKNKVTHCTWAEYITTYYIPISRVETRIKELKKDSEYKMKLRRFSLKDIAYELKELLEV